jgi:NCS1 family nucleobase:cation symporter-1
MELVRKVENIAAPYVLVMTAVLVVWAVMKARGMYLARVEADPNAPRDFWSTIGPVMRSEGKYDTFAKFWPVFVPSVTAMIGFWSTLSLNMPDFTRFGKSQKEQAVGQVVALPTTMTVFALMGIVITSASEEIYGKPMWDPIELVGKFESRLLVAIAMFTVVVATLGVNIAANVVSPANDFANVKPGMISFKTGGLITGLLGIAMVPWKLIADPNGYIFKWLLGYSGGLGSIAGVLVCDYWFVRRKALRLADLYRRDGVYAFGPAVGTSTERVAETDEPHYREGAGVMRERVRYAGSGFNGAAIAATLAGCALAWIGLVVKPLAVLYDYAWFAGAGGAAIVYGVLMRDVRSRLSASKP